MGYEAYLQELLKPLGVYSAGGTVGGILAAEGGKLDDCFAALERTEREMLLATAEDEGLESIESLLTSRPVTRDPQSRREALAALLRVGGDSFTPQAIADNLRGCGLKVTATESEKPQTVEVRFPDDKGIPPGIAELKKIIEDILPCHLAIEYIYDYVTWQEFERFIRSWNLLERRFLTWDQLEILEK